MRLRGDTSDPWVNLDGGSGATLVLRDSVDAILDLGPAASAADILFAATREITKLLGERGSCIMLDGTPRVALAPHAPEAVGRKVDLDRYPEVSTAAASQQPVIVEDAQADQRLHAVRGLIPGTLGSVAAVPLAIGRRCLGVFLVQSRDARIVGEQARATARIVARLTAALLERGDGGRHRAPTPPPIPNVTMAVLESVPALAAAASSSAAAAEATTPAPESHRILVVEDDDAIASALVDVLEDERFFVQRATTGEEALSYALSTRPDLILLDVKLPGMDGFETALRLRRAPEGIDVPLLFLSASRDLAARVREARIDNVDFMPKPYRVHELLARVEHGLTQARVRQMLRTHADRDELTGLGNLRLFRARMDNEHARFGRYVSPLALVMLDVDKLKLVNDRLGHMAGSELLRSIGAVLMREARTTDVPARYGGDEFVVLLPQTTLNEASIFAERVRAEVARIDCGGIPASVSIGVASLSVPGSLESADHLLCRADAAAYRAKRQGGNRICLEPEGAEVDNGGVVMPSEETPPPSPVPAGLSSRTTGFPSSQPEQDPAS